MTKLFEPVQIGKHTLANRVTMAPLTRQRAGEDGTPTKLHVEYYSQRATAGLVVTEGVFPAYSSRSFPGQAGLATDGHTEAWKPVAEAVHARGGVIFAQVMHGGRTSHPDLLRDAPVKAPSALPTGGDVRGFSGKTEGVVPEALTPEEIPGIVDEFRQAARRAVDAGLDGVEIHGANSYLLHEFLAPNSNIREDQYGGSPENRARLVAEVIRAVAEEIGAERTALRISPQHNIQGIAETDVQETIATYQALFEAVSDLKLAYISVLANDPEGEVVTELRRQIQQDHGWPLLLNSGFAVVTQLDEAKYIVDDLGADAAVVGRMLIANPDLVERWETGAELNEPDMDTFYVGGAKGYTDYPAMVRV
ncbi:alkene reductase [Corynebacterium casei]|uniref:alkene reductase n=3 Tax=Corynebacterium casei TaxID=160386 RepID=UPI003F916C0E